MNNKPKEEIWIAVYAGLCVSMLFPMGSLMAESGGTQTLFSAVFGAIGGAIGVLLYSLTKGKSLRLKILVGIATLLGGMLVILLLKNFLS